MAAQRNKNKELTLAELQQQRLSYQTYVWRPSQKCLLKVDEKDKTQEDRVTGSESLNLTNVIVHFRQLRAIGYSLINILQFGNAKLLLDIVTKKYLALGLHLRYDILEGIKAIDQSSIEPDLLHEALELLLNLASIKEIYGYCDSQGINLKFLEGLLNFCQKNTDQVLEERFGYKSEQSRKLLTHKILQAVNDRKGTN